MSLFEDPKLEYYRKWDRQYDEEKAKAEDARMLAYERKPLITLRSLLKLHRHSGHRLF